MYRNDVAVFIPARISSKRLPRKMLLPIKYGKTLIELVVENILQIKLSASANYDIYVATDSEEIASVLQKYDISVIMTPENCVSGSDRVYNALCSLKNSNSYRYIVNLQGDMLGVTAELIELVIYNLKQNNADIVTPAVKMQKAHMMSDSKVKIVVDSNDYAMYFSRSLIPYNADDYLLHVGIYGFAYEALKRFVLLPPSNYEQQEKLEQLRALENNFKVKICYIDKEPISIDLDSDILVARSKI